jgi:hypothetical protein
LLSNDHALFVVSDGGSNWAHIVTDFV